MKERNCVIVNDHIELIVHMIDNFAIFDKFTIRCNFNFCVRHVLILTKLLNSKRKMAEGFDENYFKGFEGAGESLDKMMEEDEEARRQGRASQDVRTKDAATREGEFEQVLRED